jgi:hypothetical protein
MIKLRATYKDPNSYNEPPRRVVILEFLQGTCTVRAVVLFKERGDLQAVDIDLLTDVEAY